MKLLLLFVGACFRSGSQGSKITDTKNSFIQQKNASESHIMLITHLNKFANVDVAINTYETIYENELKSWYNNNLIQVLINNELIGLENLINNSLRSIFNINEYDCILVIRIDLFIKEYFLSILNINSNKIQFPFICWAKCCVINNCPRIADTILFIPKKYFYLINNRIFLSHDSWYKNIKEYNLSNHDMEFMINTFHDSDSEKDFNPLYYMVSRPESKISHTNPNLKFDINKDINQYNNMSENSVICTNKNNILLNKLIKKNPSKIMLTNKLCHQITHKPLSHSTDVSNCLEVYDELLNKITYTPFSVQTNQSNTENQLSRTSHINEINKFIKAKKINKKVNFKL